MRYLITIASFFIVCMVQAQNPLRKAISLYQAQSLDSARIWIDKAEETMSDNAQLWYVKGFIYKDLYKNDPAADSLFSLRNASVQAFDTLLSMKGSEKFHPDAYKNLKYLSVTYYNEAVALLDSGKAERSRSSFGHFKEALLLSKDTTIDLLKQEISFNMSLGSYYTRLHKADTTGEQTYFREAIAIYDNVLTLDSMNVKANYNLGVLYYNEAVRVINELDYDEVDLMAFSEIEDQSIEYFQLSLPYMELANTLDENNVSTLEGLAGIYFGLREFDKSEEYKKLAEELSDSDSRED